MSIVIGIDVGKAQLEALAVDAHSGEVIAPITVMHDVDDSAAAAWARSARIALDEMHAALGTRARGVEAIALAGLDASAMVDGDGEPVLEFDGFDVAGQKRLTGFSRASCWLSAKDVVALQLCGVRGSDHSSACATGLYDGVARRWSSEALDRRELPRALFPDVGASHELLGRVTGERAFAGVRVMRGASQHSALATSVGASHDSALVSLDLVVAPTAAWVAHGALAPVMHNGGCALAGDPGAWRALAWYRDVLCDGERLAAELRGSALDALLCEAASTSQPGASGVVFVTFGDRSALVGMSHDSDKADVSRAVLDGLAYTIADALPLEVKTLRVAGALADQSIWRQWLADVVGVPVCRTTSPASAAYGAAIIAAGGAAAREPEGISAAWVHPTAQATPDPIAHDKHRDARSLHRRLREALGRQLDALSRLDDERVNDRT